MKNYSNNYSCNIFIVDDDPDDHAFLCSAIREIIPGALIKSFFDGVDVLEHLFDGCRIPDLIFLDLNMAKLGGKPTLTAVKQNESLRDIPIVVLTTDSGNHEKEIIMCLGATAYYTKPTSLNELKRIVEKIKNDVLVQDGIKR